MDKIVLIGFRATGKTSVGKKLAEALNWRFVDLDEEIQKKAGKSIKEIVEEGGWQAFCLQPDEAIESLRPR
jgi:shikimate kinase